MKISVFTEKDIHSCITLDHGVIKAVEEGFRHLIQGNATVPPIMMIPVPENHGEVDIKSAYIRGLDSMAIKIASGSLKTTSLACPTAAA